MKRCKVGGQAVMEGVMMKSATCIAMAVRTSDGTIVTDCKPCTTAAKKGTFLGFPIVRGVVAFIESLVTGMKTLTKSAELYGEDITEEEPSKFEKFLAEKMGKSVETIVIGLAVVLSICLSVGLFVALPLFIGQLAFGTEREVWRALFEGLVRMIIFIGYLYFCSAVKDIKRVFMYHGAEHKTISCYEAGDELTVENIMKHKRLHPRCGTNYMFLVMAVSILFFTAVDWIFSINLTGILFYLSRFGMRILLLPVVAGVSYEVLQAAAKSEGWLAKVVRAPGMGLQCITTREPTPDMIEVALVSFKLAMESIGEDVLIPNSPETQTAEQHANERTAESSDTSENA